jgi:hypothetical protein
LRLRPPLQSACADIVNADADGLRCFMIELRETEIDVLIRKGLLKPETRNDTIAIIDALYAHLDHTLGSPS